MPSAPVHSCDDNIYWCYLILKSTIHSVSHLSLSHQGSKNIYLHFKVLRQLCPVLTFYIKCHKLLVYFAWLKNSILKRLHQHFITGKFHVKIFFFFFSSTSLVRSEDLAILEWILAWQQPAGAEAPLRRGSYRSSAPCNAEATSKSLFLLALALLCFLQ